MHYLKGKHPEQEIKHHVGQRGYHPREWQNVMAWARVGQKAVFFHNGDTSETCIDTYWYQCYHAGDEWDMTHGEPYLLRTYCGDAEKLAAALLKILEGEEVTIPCLADGDKEQLHLRQGKRQRFKASLKRGNYDPRRDGVAPGAREDG